VIYFAYSYKLDVLIWTLLWLFTISCAYFLRTSRYGLAKDLSMAVGTMAELMAAWKIGGSASEVGWTWVRKIVCWVFFTVSIQDYRDVPGDRASGRRTIPILFGDIPGQYSQPLHFIILFNNICRFLHIARIYNSTGLLMFQVCYTALWWKVY
jgi:4-hydroxybenzoate polyprenyltransferase